MITQMWSGTQVGERREQTVGNSEIRKRLSAGRQRRNQRGVQGVLHERRLVLAAALLAVRAWETVWG